MNEIPRWIRWTFGISVALAGTAIGKAGYLAFKGEPSIEIIGDVFASLVGTLGTIGLWEWTRRLVEL